MIHGIFYKASPKTPLSTTVHSLHTLVLDATTQTPVTWLSPQCWLSQAVDRSNPLPTLHTIGSPTRAVIAAWARLDNRSEIATLLNIPQDQLHTFTCAQLILETYLQFGETCTTHLYGDFSFAIYDIEKNALFCAKDRLGVRPLYYHETDELIVISSTFTLFHQLPQLKVIPCKKWVSKFLISNLSMDFTHTAYKDIYKLPPAHQLTATPHATTISQYHTFHTSKIQLDSSEEYVNYYRTHLETTMKAQTETDQPIGAELSGGIDSSTVTAYAHKYFKGRKIDFHTFAMAHLENEPKYIFIVNQLLNIPISHVTCNVAGYPQDPLHEFKTLGAPIEHGNATSHTIFYDIASKHNIKILLSGFGGDEVVTSIHGRLYLEELLKEKKYITIHQQLGGNFLVRTLKLFKFLFYKQNPMAEAFQNRWPETIVKEDLIQYYNLKTEYDDKGQWKEGYTSLDQFTLERCLTPHVSTRLENCTIMAASYGIEYRWPLLDARLVQAFLSTPSKEKYHKGIGRYLHKRAITPTVPKEIATQNSKYMGEKVSKSTTIPTLNLPLHPNLSDIIDIPKLTDQLAKLTSQTDIPLNKEITMKKNILTINQLNHWLNYYYPNGFEW